MSFLSQDDVISDITNQLRGDGGVGDSSNVPTPAKDSEMELKKDSKVMKKTLKRKQQKKVTMLGKRKVYQKRNQMLRKKIRRGCQKRNEI